MWLATAACDARGLPFPCQLAADGAGQQPQAPPARYVPVPLSLSSAAATKNDESGGGLSGLARELRAAAAWCCARAAHERLLHELDALGADYEELLLPPPGLGLPATAVRSAASAHAPVLRLLRLPGRDSGGDPPSSSSSSALPSLPRAARRRDGLPGPACVGVGQVLLTADGEGGDDDAATRPPRCGQRWSLWLRGAFYAGTVPGEDAGAGWLRVRCAFDGDGQRRSAGGVAAALLGTAAASARLQRALAALEALARGRQSLPVAAPLGSASATSQADAALAAAAAGKAPAAAARAGSRKRGADSDAGDGDGGDGDHHQRSAKRPRSGTPPPEAPPALLLWHWPGTALVRLVAVSPTSLTLEAGPPVDAPLPGGNAPPTTTPQRPALRLVFSWGHHAPDADDASGPRVWMRAARAARLTLSVVGDGERGGDDSALRPPPLAAAAALAAAATEGDWSFVLDAAALCGWPLAEFRRGARLGGCPDAAPPAGPRAAAVDGEEAPLRARALVVAPATAAAPAAAAAVAIDARFFSHGRVLLALRPVPPGTPPSRPTLPLPSASVLASAFLSRLEDEARAGQPAPAAWPAVAAAAGDSSSGGAFWVHASSLGAAVARLAEFLRREVLM